MFKHLIPVCLTLHDGAAAAPAPSGTQAPAVGQQGKGGAPVATTQPAAVSQPAANTQAPAAPTPEERTANYEKFKAEHKDLFDADFQKAFNPRFKQLTTKAEAAEAQSKKLSPLMDVLSKAYGDSDPEKLTEQFMKQSTLIDDLAEKSGMTRDGFLNDLATKRENAELKAAQTSFQNQQTFEQNKQRWDAEAIEVQKRFKDFNWIQEAGANPLFAKLLNNGVPMMNVVTSIHPEWIAQQVGQQTTQQMVSTIMAGQRPVEAGASQQPAAATSVDPSKLSRKQLADYRTRIRNGEKIDFKTTF